jgi:predicted Zn-dependent peptidase
MVGHRLVELPAWQDRERFALVVLAEILGGREGISRIVGRLRTSEGLVYRAAVRLDPGELWPGELQIFFDAGSESVARAVAAILEEIERLRSTPVHLEELEIVKRSLLARLRLAFDTAEEVVGTFAEDELLGRPHAYWQSYLRGIEAVSAEAILAAARSHLRPDRALCLVVGRWAELAGDADPGGSALENAVGGPVHHLPARDPLSLEPVVGAPIPQPAGKS